MDVPWSSQEAIPAPALPPAPALNRFAHPSAPRPLRLILIEDEWTVAQAIKGVVETLGHIVCGLACDEQEALVLADRTRPNLALTDVRLAAGGDGIVAARALAAGFGVRSIFLSGQTDHATMRRLTETYPLGVVHKPFSAIQLKNALDLAGRRLRLRGHPA